MDHHVIMKKYRMFLYGMIVAALGISMITKAELGTSPITSPSYVLTFIFPYSLGVFVLAVNSTLFLFECLVLGRSFKKIQPVSYTHLDVYKRQMSSCSATMW